MRLTKLFEGLFKPLIDNIQYNQNILSVKITFVNIKTKMFANYFIIIFPKNIPFLLYFPINVLLWVSYIRTK